MKTADFDYVLPPELIAQTPLADRQNSRLLVCERDGFGLRHEHFYNLPDHFEQGDVLVVNDTRVLPARLTGVKRDTDAVIEILLLRQIAGDLWETLAKPAKRVKVGSVVWFGDG
ncbi:MAG TPA: tRNA preQ1(34) S-adenosylmethionine ribosyltransferase-isomerase QueA, partial [Acholeplasmatales bacterium]|nr:tRNA preQ1(34) S-adenosylmethionine ribosyltransferase-isomerase QueA [Acholeplasmatales bacterium]